MFFFYVLLFILLLILLLLHFVLVVVLLRPLLLYAFYATLESVVDQCPRRDTLLVLGDFNASTGTDRDDYKTCVGPHGSGTVNLSDRKCVKMADFVNFGKNCVNSFKNLLLQTHQSEC